MLHLLAIAGSSAPTGGLGALLPQAFGIPAEWRIGAMIVTGAYALSRPVPFAIRHLSRAAALLARAIVAICLFGPYLHTRRQLAAGTGPHPVAIQIDGWLASAFGAIDAACAEAARVLGKRRPLRGWWLAVAALALVPEVLAQVVEAQPRPPSTAVALYSTTAAVWRPVDGLVMTGRLRAVPRTIDCSASQSPTTAAVR
jgi:hypothetical protein